MLALLAAVAGITVSLPVPPSSVLALLAVSLRKSLKLPSGSGFLPVPRLTRPPITWVPSVMVLLELPPIRVATSLTVPVLARLASVSLLLPEPRSTEMPVVSADESVIVLLPAPPARVATLPMLAVLLPVASVRVSAPEPRLTLPLLSTVAIVMVSVPAPPISVATSLMVPALTPLFSVDLLLPMPRLTGLPVESTRWRA